MRKWMVTHIPAFLLVSFFTTVLITCGGGGGGGGSPKTLTGLSITGPPSMSEYGAATYTATASWDDNTTSTVIPDWSVNLQMASISTGGVLSCAGIDADQMVTITATYSSGGVDEMTTMNVTVTDIATIPFTTEMVSGQAFFEEYSFAGGGYLSFLSSFSADSSFEQYVKEDDSSDYVTGTWSIDTYGNLIINISGQGTVTVGLISDSATEVQAVFDEGTEPPPMGTLEKIVPVDPAKLPGTYAGSDGYMWVFNADRTGSVSIYGGIDFTWSVDSDGVLRMPSNTGYTASLYARATSQSTATEYTVLNVVFPEHNTSTGAFFEYYGGLVLTRQ